MENKQKKAAAAQQQAHARRHRRSMAARAAMMKQFHRERTAPAAAAVPMQSQLRTVARCQIKLVPVNAPYFDGAKLLIAADCTAYAYAAISTRSSSEAT